MSREIDAYHEAKTIIDPAGYGGEERNRNIAIVAGLFYIGKCIESALIAAAEIITKSKG